VTGNSERSIVLFFTLDGNGNVVERVFFSFSSVSLLTYAREKTTKQKKEPAAV
jgi:hypothetical protein